MGRRLVERQTLLTTVRQSVRVESGKPRLGCSRDLARRRRIMETLGCSVVQRTPPTQIAAINACEKGAVIITNDLYRDAVDEVDGKANKHTLRTWFKTHCCSYTFVVDEFLPNPDFNFPPAE